MINERHIEPTGLIPGRGEGARARGEPCVRCCKKLVTTHDRRPRDDVLPAVRALARGHCVTWTGVELEAIAPFPSCPAKLSPQQYTRPLDVAPQLVSPCASTPLKLSPLATATATGVVRDVVVPSPSWPWALSPQQ